MTARIVFATTAIPGAASRSDRELWSYDPSSDAAPIDLGVALPPSDSFVAIGGLLVLAAIDPIYGNLALAATDGTQAGTHLLTLPTGSGSLIASVQSVAAFGTEALVTATAANGSQALLLTNGGQSGTVAASIGVNATQAFNIGGDSFIAGSMPVVGSVATPTQGLWISNGTQTGTVRLTPASVSITISAMAAVGDGSFLFLATQPGSDAESLWITNGTAVSTQPLLVAGLAGGPAATALSLYTPSQITPGAAITLTGTYSGNPVALDYNFGAGWVEAQSVTFANGAFSFTVPAGMPAGAYIPQVRDHFVPSVGGTAGQFIVSAWTPETVSSSPGATAIFEFDANDPTIAATGAGGAVTQVRNSINTAEYLTAMSGADANPVIILNQSGADGHRRLLRFDATAINPNLNDPKTNFLSAGGVNGAAGNALVDLANSTDLGTTGAFTTIIALKIDTAYSYEAGPIWGTLGQPGTLQYAQLRANMADDSQGANVTDTALNTANAQGVVTAGWHVMTMIKNGATLTYRLDGAVVQTSTINSTQSFTATDFMIGGGFPQGSDYTKENGVPPPYVGEFQAYSGVLAGSDLSNAEALAANAIGVVLPGMSTTPTPPAITNPVPAPAAATPMLTVGSLAYFVSPDTAGNTMLWVSNGTAVGTIALAPASGSPAALGNLVLFSGAGSAGEQGLWRSDGTIAGTFQLSTLGSRAAAGSAPGDITAFGTLAAFTATDAQGKPSLWVTDGTAAGTQEIVPAGSDAAGLDPTGLSVFYGQLVFTGTDAKGQSGLWMSDGTVAGTQEVATVPGGAAIATSELGATIPGGRKLQLGGSATLYDATDGDTIMGGAGAATVIAATGSVLMTGGSGTLKFVGGTGASTVTGGAGAVTLLGGGGGGVYTGGTSGADVLVAGGGNTSLTGGSTGARLFGSASGNDVLVAAEGRESLIGGGGNSTIDGGATQGAVIFTSGNSSVSGGAAGADTIVGGGGSLIASLHGDAVFSGGGPATISGGSSGADSIIGGSGSITVTGHGDTMILVGGAGVATVNTGPGANLVFAGSGAMSLTEGTGPGTLVLGAGKVAVNEGLGSMAYDIVDGAAGGTATIQGYRPGTDQIDLFGYGLSPGAFQTSTGNSVLTLPDGTRITLSGVTGMVPVLHG